MKADVSNIINQKLGKTFCFPVIQFTAVPYYSQRKLSGNAMYQLPISSTPQYTVNTNIQNYDPKILKQDSKCLLHT